MLVADQPLAPAAIRTDLGANYVSTELSNTTWLITSLSPGAGERMHVAARELIKLGYTVRLIPTSYIKPFVKRQKNDAVDAEAICEAAQRPNMRYVVVKS